MLACMKGLKKIIKLLIKAGCDLNIKDQTNNTALHYVCIN